MTKTGLVPQSGRQHVGVRDGVQKPVKCADFAAGCSVTVLFHAPRCRCERNEIKKATTGTGRIEDAGSCGASIWSVSTPVCKIVHEPSQVLKIDAFQAAGQLSSPQKPRPAVHCGPHESVFLSYTGILMLRRAILTEESTLDESWKILPTAIQHIHLVYRL